MSITCDHGRRPWKCHECKLEEIKRWSAPTVAIIDDLSPVSLSPVKQSELVKAWYDMKPVNPDHRPYHKLKGIMLKHGYKLTSEDAIALANKVADHTQIKDFDLRQCDEYQPGYVHLIFAGGGWQTTVGVLYSFHLEGIKNCFTAWGFNEFNKCLKSLGLATSRVNVNRLIKMLQPYEGWLLGDCHHGTGELLLTWETTSGPHTRDHCVEHIRLKFYEVTGTQHYDAYDGLASIIYREISKRPDPSYVRLLSTKLYPHSPLTKCRPYGNIPELIRLTWGSGLSEYTMSIKREQLKFRYLQIQCDLLALESGEKGDVIRAELLDGSTEFDAFKAGLKGETRKVTRSHTDFYTIGPCTIHIDRACELVIGDQKYQVRFEGKKGHIIPC